MVKALRVLGMIWCSCWAAPALLFYVLPAWGLGWLTYEGFAAFGVARFRVVEKTGWHHSLWIYWGGLCLGWAIILNNETKLTEFHELEHVPQWLAWGPLFVPLYGFCGLAYGYQANPFEVAARERAAAAWSWYVRVLNDMKRGAQ